MEKWFYWVIGVALALMLVTFSLMPQIESTKMLFGIDGKTAENFLSLEEEFYRSCEAQKMHFAFAELDDRELDSYALALRADVFEVRLCYEIVQDREKLLNDADAYFWRPSWVCRGLPQEDL